MFNKNTILKITFYFLIILFLIFVFNYIKKNTSIKETFENELLENKNDSDFKITKFNSLENDSFKNTDIDLSKKNFLNAGYHSNINSNNKRTENLQLRPDPPVEKTKNSLVTKS